MTTLSYIFTGVETPKGIILRPLLSVTMWHGGYEPIDTAMIVDSGADFSIIPRGIAESLRINIGACPRDITSGVGGDIDVAESEIHIEFGQRGEIQKLKIPVQIPLKKDITYALLGREPFFSMFDISFRMGYCEGKGKFVIKKVTKRRPSKRYPKLPVIRRKKY